jgi:tRNA U34 5-methylaminomethyl-2-thiouridine-forming methyltransferase MnmC
MNTLLLITETTADGSLTLFVPEMNEHYHSTNGAVTESMHVFINAGFKQCAKPKIHILEFGFGTGLNALLTALEAQKSGVEIAYTALEKYPLSSEIVSKLNYNQLDDNLFRQIHNAEWDEAVAITPKFTLHKIACDFNDFAFADKYDIVYYDAFAPDKQPEVWTEEIFSRIFTAMNEFGILTTYCAKGSVRRMMQAAVFVVDRLPGPPVKREMLRAFVGALRATPLQ